MPPNKALQRSRLCCVSDSQVGRERERDEERAKCLPDGLSVPVAKILNTVAHIRTENRVVHFNKNLCNLTNADFTGYTMC